MGFIRANREQEIIFGYCLDDFVEKDSKCRYILKIVDQLDLRELYNNYSKQGAESYDPKMLLSIWFLAYSEGITSSRVIEKLCKKHMDFIFISGNLKPDHSTLCRFIQRNQELWPKYFLEILEIAKKKRITDFKSIMIDGTKIQAKSSRKQSITESKLSRYLEAVKEDIKKYEQEIQLTEIQEDKQEKQIKIEQLKKKEKLLQERKTELQKRKANLKNQKYKDEHKINLVEEDAMMMDLGNGKGYQAAYNGQIAVDAKTHLIVSYDLVQDRNDENQFSEMHQNTENNLGKDQQRLYGADGGYHCFEQLEYGIINNLNFYIADPKLKHYKPVSYQELNTSQREVHYLDFKYNNQEDNYICPAGKKLGFFSKTDNNIRKGRTYISKECLECQIKDKCLSKQNKNGLRTIFRDHREEYAEKMRSKLSTEEAKEVMMQRQTSVEPVFGNIKENLGLRRFRMKELKNVRNEFALMCIVHNLNKLFKLIFYSKFLQIRKILYSIPIVMQFRTHGKDFYHEINGTSLVGAVLGSK